MVKLLQLLYVFAPIIAFIITLIAIPAIIKVATIKHLFDEVGDTRKIHKTRTPNLGGIAIFAALLICLSLFINAQILPYYNYLVASSIMLFIIGIKDDLIGVDSKKKFAVQFLAAGIIAILADIRVHSFYGVFGIESIPYFLSIAFSILTIVFIINAFNLIDGIDGLAGIIGTIVMVSFGALFGMANQDGLAVLCFTYLGCLLGFLKYNIAPAKIFMGDTGSLLLGFIAAVLFIQFINIGPISTPASLLNAKPAVAVAILIIPIFDTLRVFTLRLLKKSSPFKADRNHIHHRLIDLGFSHSQTVIILTFINILFITLAVSMQWLGTQWLLLLMFIVAMVFNGMLTLRIKKGNNGIAKEEQTPFKSATNV